MKTETERKILNAINDYIVPIIVELNNIGEKTAVDEAEKLRKATVEIFRAIEED